MLGEYTGELTAALQQLQALTNAQSGGGGAPELWRCEDEDEDDDDDDLSVIEEATLRT